MAQRAAQGSPAGLPELAALAWRPRLDAVRLRAQERLWTGLIIAHVVPLLAVGALLLAIEPLTFPMALIGAGFAWWLPALYANRGAVVVAPRRTRQADAVERTALGLLGDLIGRDAAALHERSGLVLERGALGAWLVGEGGALLVRPGGRRVDAWCVRVDEPDLPGADRIAHLLLALREDELGFATIANLSFSGACWRIRRRLPAARRPALAAAHAAARGTGPLAS